MQPLYVMLVCFCGLVCMEEINQTNENKNARDTAAATGKNSHVVGGDTGNERAEEEYDSGKIGLRLDVSGNWAYGAGYGGRRRKRVADGYLGVTGLQSSSFRSDLGLESEFPIGGRMFGKRRKRWDGGSVGGTMVGSGSQPTGMEHGGNILGVWRRKRATHVHGLDKGVLSGSPRTAVEYGGGIGGGIGWPLPVPGRRRRRAADGNRGDTDGRQRGTRSGFGYGGFGGIAPWAAWGSWAV